MTSLRHSDRNAPRAPKGKPFRLMETLRERRYRRMVCNIERCERRIDDIRGRMLLLEQMAECSKASIVDEDERNWDEAMSKTKEAARCRRQLRPESREATFGIFSKNVFMAAVGGTIILAALHAALPGISPFAAAAVGGLLLLGTIMRTFGQVTTHSEEFIEAVSSALRENMRAAKDKRLDLIRKLHGWKSEEE